MPIPAQEIVTTLMPGETVKVVGPGILEFKATKMAALGNAAAGGAVGAGAGAGGVAAGGVVAAGGGTGAAVGGGNMMMTAGGMTTATATPVSKLLSGKVLGLSLGTVNPWILLGVGALGGYMYFKKSPSM
ncbi:MAG: hypothetical protein HQL53_11245 [Magnetococcales bacterium]|nr:hypothetical protein [Magnetococcales bacterium]